MMQHLGDVRVNTLRGQESYDLSAFKGEVISTRKTNATNVHGKGGGTSGPLPGYQKDIEVSSTTTHYHEIAMRADDGTEIDFELVNWDFPLRVGEMLTMVQTARPMHNPFFFAAVKHNTKDVYVKEVYLRNSFTSDIRVWINIFLYAIIGFVLGGGMYVFNIEDTGLGGFLTLAIPSIYLGWKLGYKLTPKFKTAILRYTLMIPIILVAIYIVSMILGIIAILAVGDSLDDTQGLIFIGCVLAIIGAIWGYIASMNKAKRAVKAFLDEPIVKDILIP